MGLSKYTCEFTWNGSNGLIVELIKFPSISMILTYPIWTYSFKLTETFPSINKISSKSTGIKRGLTIYVELVWFKSNNAKSEYASDFTISPYTPNVKGFKLGFPKIIVSHQFAFGESIHW